MNLETAAIAVGVILIAGSAGVIIYAVLVSRAKGRRLAAAYTRTGPIALDEVDRRLGLDPNRFSPANNPTAAARRAWGVDERRAAADREEPLRPAYSSRATDPAYTMPSFSDERTPVMFGDPVPLASDPAPAAIEGGGGEFGGAGASGGWDSGGGGGEFGGAGASGGWDSGGGGGGDSSGGSSSND